MSGVGVGGGTLTVLLLLWKGIQYFNHRHIRSTCCGKSAEVGIDIDSPATSSDPLPHIRRPSDEPHETKE